MKSGLMILLLLATRAFAAEPTDTLYLVDGKALAGIITSASTGSVTLTKEREQIVFNKSAVNRYVFSCADQVLLRGGDTLTCKILKKQGDTLAVVTSSGPRVLAKEEYSGMFFGTGTRLVATELPETDQAFRPLQPQSAPGAVIKLYLRVGYGFHSGTLDQWKQAWWTHEAPTSGPVIPVEAGFILGSHWTLGGGYENFETQTLEGSNPYGSFTGDLAYDFIFIGGRWVSTPVITPWLRIYGGGDVGSITITEHLRTAAGATLVTDPTSATIGLRVKAGATASLTQWMGLFFEGGFLFAKADPVQFSRTDLDMSGPSALLGIEFHFAL